MAGKLVPSHFSDVFCYNFIGCVSKIFRFLIDLRYFGWSLVAYESFVIYKSLVEHRTFVLLGSFVLLDSFVLYGFLSYLRSLKCFSYFSFVDVFILPYLSPFVTWQSEHIFDCIFIYFLFYKYIIPIPALQSRLSREGELLYRSSLPELIRSEQGEGIPGGNRSSWFPRSRGRQVRSFCQIYQTLKW